MVRAAPPYSSSRWLASALPVVLRCSTTVVGGRTMFLRNERCEVDEIRCTFDRVFDVHSTQEEVYAHTAKPLVHEFLQGYNWYVAACPLRLGSDGSRFFTLLVRAAPSSPMDRRAPARPTRSWGPRTACW
jgi:hypothetical protein